MDSNRAGELDTVTIADHPRHPLHPNTPDIKAPQPASHAMTDRNPYDAPQTRVLASDREADEISYQWRWLDTRCIVVGAFSLLVGAFGWQALSLLYGTPIHQPPFFAFLGWCALTGLVTGCFDSRSPWISWLAFFVGTYIFNLPFMQADPLMPLGVVFGALITAAAFFVVALPASLIVHFYPVRSMPPAVKWWAGYTEVTAPPA